MEASCLVSWPDRLCKLHATEHVFGRKVEVKVEHAEVPRHAHLYSCRAMIILMMSACLKEAAVSSTH